MTIVTDTTTVPRDQWEELFAAGAGFLAADEREMRLLAGHLPAAGGALLDVGCGLGGYAARLAELGFDVTAVDWAASSVTAVRDRYQDLVEGLTVRQVDFADEESVSVLPEGGFDVVTMRLVFAFFTDKAAVAERVRRLLRPGGVWVVTTSLADRLAARRHIGITGEEVAGLLAGWGSGVWYDLAPGGVRCFVLRA